MRSIIFISLTFIISFYAFAQNVSFQIDGSTDEAELLNVEGEKNKFIQKLHSQNGGYKFSLKDKPFGFYRFEIDDKHYFDFVHCGENINIKTEFHKIIDSLKIIESKSNSIFYEYRKLNISFKNKIELLQFILLRYPKDDKYYLITLKTLDDLQNDYTHFVSRITEEDPNSFISRYVRTSQLPVVPLSIPIHKRLDYLKFHALDNVDFNDAELIFSDAFTNKSIEYLTYYRNPQLTKLLLEKEFMKAVDTLLNKAKVNQLVYQHITDYLIDGFKQFGFDKIIDYIIENYVIQDELCLDEETENSIQRRIDQSRLLSIGTKVININALDINGESFDLYKIQSDRILLVFYSIHCPHCKTLLPQLSKLQKSQGDLNIIAISLDNKEEWTKFVNDTQLRFMDINDPNGWDGQLASDFYIYATPSLFLLDKEKKIISKPTSYEELVNSL